MKTDIVGGPAFARLSVELAPGDSIVAESSAMANMAADLAMQSRLNGGLLRGLLRKLFGGESLFINRFSNETGGARALTLVPPVPGEIRAATLAAGESLYLQPGAFLACSDGVQMQLRWAGFVSLIAREGLFRMEMVGPGTVWYGAYGAMLTRELDGEWIVDSGHLVAYEPGVSLKLQLPAGMVASLFSGEGFVTRLEGRGKVIIQTRSLTGLAGWLNPKLR